MKSVSVHWIWLCSQKVREIGMLVMGKIRGNIYSTFSAQCNQVRNPLVLLGEFLDFLSKFTKLWVKALKNILTWLVCDSCLRPQLAIQKLRCHSKNYVYFSFTKNCIYTLYFNAPFVFSSQYYNFMIMINSIEFAFGWNVGVFGWGTELQLHVALSSGCISS